MCRLPERTQYNFTYAWKGETKKGEFQPEPYVFPEDFHGMWIQQCPLSIGQYLELTGKAPANPIPLDFKARFKWRNSDYETWITRHFPAEFDARSADILLRYLRESVSLNFEFSPLDPRLFHPSNFFHAIKESEFESYAPFIDTLDPSNQIHQWPVLFQRRDNLPSNQPLVKYLANRFLLQCTQIYEDMKMHQEKLSELSKLGAELFDMMGEDGHNLTLNILNALGDMVPKRVLYPALTRLVGEQGCSGYQMNQYPIGSFGFREEIFNLSLTAAPEFTPPSTHPRKFHVPQKTYNRGLIRLALLPKA